MACVKVCASSFPFELQNRDKTFVIRNSNLTSSDRPWAALVLGWLTCPEEAGGEEAQVWPPSSQPLRRQHFLPANSSAPATRQRRKQGTPRANRNRDKRQMIKLSAKRTRKEGNLSSAESRAAVTERCCLTASVSPTARPVGLACQHRLVRCRVRRAARRNVHTHTGGDPAKTLYPRYSQCLPVWPIYNNGLQLGLPARRWSAA